MAKILEAVTFRCFCGPPTPGGDQRMHCGDAEQTKAPKDSKVAKETKEAKEAKDSKVAREAKAPKDSKVAKETKETKETKDCRGCGSRRQRSKPVVFRRHCLRFRRHNILLLGLLILITLSFLGCRWRSHRPSQGRTKHLLKAATPAEVPTHGNRTAMAVRALVHGGTVDMAPEAAGAIILMDRFVGRLLHGKSQPRWRLCSRGGGCCQPRWPLLLW